jgi:putative thioredoxin
MEATLETFEAMVVHASANVPVLVDFWAPWCGPCRVLGPMLEKLETAYRGRWKLVKVNSDENPELAAHFRVRGIPHVVAFVDGVPADQFTGVLPESQLRAFIDRLLPAPAQVQRSAARQALLEGRREQAEQALRTALALDPSYDDARLDLIELLLDGDRFDDVGRELPLLSPKTTQGIDARFNALKTRFDAARVATSLPDTAALDARLSANPGDLDARFDLASLLIAHRQYDDALGHLLEIVVRDRSFRDDIGRKTMLSVFELAADRPELVSAWRRKLSAALF